MSQSKKGNRFQISFKENIKEIELMNYMLEQAEIVGISAYIKTLIAQDMKKCSSKKEVSAEPVVIEEVKKEEIENEIDTIDWDF